MARVKCPRCFHVNPDGQDECEQCHAPLPRIHIEAKPGPAAATSSAITFHQGQLVANRYTVMNIIGRGGMGCIYKVHDRILGEEVALKTLLPQLVQDKLVVERFFNEARIARKLSHPHIVRVHDIGVAGDTIYISMEFIRGNSLRALLEQCGPNQRLPLGRILTVFEELCAALDYAHQYTVHRDIKPENVMIDEHGRVKLMDFGISKLMADTRMTGASVVMGTPFYMAPEQFRNSRDVDARADIYSVGVMLYEILTGVIPTGVPKPASEMRSGMPPGLDAVVMKCVEPDPAKRYATAAELRQALIPLRVAIAGGAPAKGTRRPKSGRTLPVRRVAGILLALAAVVGAGAGSFYAGAMVPASAPPVEVSTPAVTPEAPSGLQQYQAVIERLRAAAEGRTGDGQAAAVAVGNGFWERAGNLDSTGDSAGALEFAEKALQCFAAAVMKPEGMAFIPPGETVVDGQRVAVEGFLIDETEVTAGAFRRFTQQVEGG
ncbi:MAG: protein kinase, partial [Candidatus Hydrogenedentes bacterium]|nr:protein kinase [Candidatus Hydrogenedentota bacterium]